MANLLSGSKLRTGGSGEFLPLKDAQPQLPATDSTTTGFTLVTNSLLQTSYRSSLGNIEFDQSTMYSNQELGKITVLATGTTTESLSTDSGTLVVTGGVGIGRNLWVREDIHVNSLTIGKGFEGKNNIVIKGDAEEILLGGANGQETIVIGYDTLKGLDTAYRSIAIGSHSLTSGTQISETIAIGNRSMENLGVIRAFYIGTITNVSLTNPVVIESFGHGLTTGTAISIKDIVGTVELNDTEFFVNVNSVDLLELYSDAARNIPVDGTAYTSYISSGTVSKVVSTDNNISIGNDSAPVLVNGGNNFFIGNRTARNLTTGSYNFFIGTDVGNNLTNVSGVISIGGESIVDGRDNQVNIGSIFYYDGVGLSEIFSSVQVGIGEDAVSTNTGALVVTGGVGVSGSVYSKEGIADEDYLLYTPRVFVQSFTPNDPRIGDFWININTFAYLQYINDDGNRIWIQVSSI